MKGTVFARPQHAYLNRQHFRPVCPKTRLVLRLFLVGLIAAGFLLTPGFHTVSAASAVLRVTPTGGTSATCGEAADWSNPCSLQTALARARSDSTILELWLQEGLYKPDSTNRSASFNIRPGLHVFGGFTGSETSRSQRVFTEQDNDPSNDRLTILSGDINTSGVATDNSFHVVTINSGPDVVVLDHLVIAGGYANGNSADSYGAGVYITGGRAYLSNVKVVNNEAKQDGGGLYAGSSSIVTIVYSQFLNNIAGSNGGGVFTRDSQVTISTSLFYGNISNGGDGAYAGINGALTISNSIFWDNPGTSTVDIQSQSGQQSQSIDIDNSVIEGGCPTGVTCPDTVISAPSDPLLTVGTPITIGGITFPNITIPDDSSYFDYVSDLLTPADPYDLDGDGNTGVFPYDINGGLVTPTAVIFSDFRASVEDGAIRLDWETASEIDNVGFNLYRLSAGSAQRSQVNSELIPAQSPGSLMGAVYSYLDPGADPAVACDYYLEAIDVNGASQFAYTRYEPPGLNSNPGNFLFIPLIQK